MSILTKDDILRKIKNSLLLEYSEEIKPGISRIKKGNGFCFYSPQKKLIKDQKEKERLMRLGVPPSYENVWYCPKPNGHLQATGHDSKLKKQYFYHELWRLMSEEKKFSNMSDFGKALPKFRRKISRILLDDIDYPSKERVLAAMFKIVDETGIRVGNSNSQKKNKTYGISTLRKKHLKIDKDHIRLKFKGKGGVERDIEISNDKIRDVIRDCVEIGGQHLFDYIDEKTGKVESVTSCILNSYLKENMGEKFSIKDFRTWRFSVYFLQEVLSNKNDEKTSLQKILKNVAKYSGNTPAILKKNYIHPALMEAFKNNDYRFFEIKKDHGLLKYENYFMNFLQKNL